MATLAGFEPAFSTLKGFLGEVPARHPRRIEHVIEMSETKPLTDEAQRLKIGVTCQKPGA